MVVMHNIVNALSVTNGEFYVMCISPQLRERMKEGREGGREGRKGRKGRKERKKRKEERKNQGK